MGITYLVGSVFQAPKSHAIAHFLSQDLNSQKGFAKTIESKFGVVANLKQQNLNVGSIGITKSDRTILSIIINPDLLTVPTKENVQTAVNSLLSTCQTENILSVSFAKSSFCLDKVLEQSVLDMFNFTFAKSGVNLFVWRWKPGNLSPNASLLLPDVMLAGDSNFLRILNSQPGTRQGHVISGGNIQSVLFSLQHSLPTEKLFFMCGTNDLLFYQKQNFTKRQVVLQLRPLLRKVMKVLSKIGNTVTILTIPPCPLLEESNPAFNVDKFNALLCKISVDYGFSILNVNQFLSNEKITVINPVDRLHLSKIGVNMVRKMILDSLGNS